MLCIIVSFVSCQDSEIESTDREVAKIDELQLDDFVKALDEYGNVVIPILRNQETRSENGIVSFTDEELEILKTECIYLAKEGRRLFLSMGITEEELNELYMGENECDIALAAVICTNMIKQNYSTRAITGNDYIDCALLVAGFDLSDALREGGEAAVKKVLKKVATKLLGPIGAAITVGEYVLCLGGIG